MANDLERLREAHHLVDVLGKKRAIDVCKQTIIDIRKDIINLLFYDEEMIRALSNNLLGWEERRYIIERTAQPDNRN